MIPSLEDILRMLVNGECTQELALEWIEEIYGLKRQRDDIAIEAMNGELASQNESEGWTEGYYDKLAKKCYAIADALIAKSNR